MVFINPTIKDHIRDLLAAWVTATHPAGLCEECDDAKAGIALHMRPLSGKRGPFSMTNQLVQRDALSKQTP